jgi:hypothetical protein
MMKTVVLLFLTVGFCGDMQAVEDPVRTFLVGFTPLAGGDDRFFSDDVLMRVDADLDGDGVNEVFLTLQRDRNGKQGNGWAVYKNRNGDYKYVGGVSFGGDDFYVGPVEELSRHGLVTFWPGGGGTGVLLAYTLEKGKIKESTIGEVDRDRRTGELKGRGRLNKYFGGNNPATQHKVQTISAPEFARRYGIKVESKTFSESLRE